MAKFQEPKINKSFVEVFEIEESSFITVIDGWRIRIHFDEKQKEQIRIGQLIEVEHEGEIIKPHSLRFKKFQ